MLKEEFEKLARVNVTQEQYKHIEALYMDSDMDKQTFVKHIRGMVKTLKQADNEPVLTMAYHNRYGQMKTPNGAYYMTVKVRLVSVNIADGLRTVKVIPDSFSCGYSYDLTDWDANLKVIQ